MRRPPATPLVRMVELLAQENALLLAQDFTRAAGLGAQKAEALAAMVDVVPAPEEMETLRQLLELARTNGQLLSAAIALQSRLMDVLADALCEATAEPATYGGTPTIASRQPALIVSHA
jgi:transposase-like protein